MSPVFAFTAGIPGHALRNVMQAIAALAGACILLTAQPALADDYADVTRLLRGGQSVEAMTKIDAFLDKHPRDMQMRFIKGVALTEQGKAGEAITLFTRLTEDHPDLPEPYNNLAVLFAASGQYDKARAALDMAIRTNPSYATAYENLGDVHAKLASQAYDKALQLDSGNAAAKSKLTLLRTLAVNAAGKGGTGPAASQAAASGTPAAPVIARPVQSAPPAPVVIARIEPVKPVVAAKPEPKVDARPETKAAAKAEPKPAPAPSVVARNEIEAKAANKTAVKPDVTTEQKPDMKAISKAEIKPAVKPEVKPEMKPPVPVLAAGNADQDEVLAIVNDWAAAWSAQDVPRYLGHYGNDFETPKGEPRKHWADERTTRIAGKGRIMVKVESPQVSVSGNQATVKFRQVYSSDRLQADSRKTLVLTRQGGKWHIKQERAGT